MSDKPRVAVIGASVDRRKSGNKAVRAYAESGFEVLPVNPAGGTIEGLTVYRSVGEISGAVDYVSLYVPPAVGLKVLPDIAAKAPRELWINPGAESDELIEAAADLKLRTVVACSVLALGMELEEFSDQ